MKRLVYLGAAGAAMVAVYWAWAQAAPQPFAEVFPAGALLYLEARDFGALVADWNASAEKTAWLGSANYDAFSRSKLFLKLGSAQAEFAAAAGVPPDYALLSNVAGGNSALAMYSIGNLEFLYATHLASARALNTALWKARGSYQTRRAGGVDYYVKEDAASHRVAAFAYAGDVLLLATKEDLIAAALQRLAGQGPAAIGSEKWFADATRAAAPGARDLRLVYDMAKLTATPHFRSYWRPQNITALKEFSGGLTDLERASGEMRERRVMLRANASAAVADEGAAGQVLALVPDDAGFWRAAVNPSGDRAAEWIEENLFAASGVAGPKRTAAPAVATSGDAGSEEDLESRIDEAPLVDDRTALAFTGLRQRFDAARIEAMLEVRSTRVAADQVFVGSQSAVVLLARDAWDADGVRAALTQAAGSLWSNGAIGTGWRAGAVQELDGLGKLALAIDGRWLVVGDSADLVRAVLARRGRPAVAGAVYAAGWRHARELPNFERMMRLIDFPQIPPAADPAAAREPMFYSENIASLGRALRRVQSETIEVHDAGTMLRESVVYRIAP